MSRANSAAKPKLILVTGAGGYIGLNVVKELSKEGHKIRASVRDANDKKKTEVISKAAKDNKYPIEFVSADLLKPDTWKSALKDVNIVMHVASPYPNETPKDVENELIRPAVEGTLNVLKAAFEANVSRVVLTSSCAAVFNFTVKDTVFTEKDWPG